MLIQKIKITLLTLFLASLATITYAQKFIYDLDFLFFFDNREYHTPYNSSQTLLGTRISPEIGLIITPQENQTHKLVGGVQYLQPLNKFKNAKIYPTIYYEYQTKPFKLLFGAIPYTKLTQELPEIYCSDSLSYFYPNIQGALLQYIGKKGFIELYCDWYGLQSIETREAFQLMAHGEFRTQYFYTKGYLTLSHLANKAAPTPRLGVSEKLIVNPIVGINFSSLIPIDSLNIQIGYILSYNRERETHTEILHHGFHADFHIQWRFLSFKNSFFYGQNMMPFYNFLGTEFYRGNPFYQSNIYNRTDIEIHLFRKEFVNCKLSWNIHYTKGYKLGHQQQIILLFDLEKIDLSTQKKRK